MPTNDIARRVRDDVLDSIKSHERALTCPAGDRILAWDNGLGVAWTRDGSAFATSLLSAHAVSADAHERGDVRNGHGEAARLVERRVAVAAYLPALREIAAQVGA